MLRLLVLLAQFRFHQYNGASVLAAPITAQQTCLPCVKGRFNAFFVFTNGFTEHSERIAGI
jgi:hypothetical protein